MTFCARCQVDVVPKRANHCPLCGSWVAGNLAALDVGLRSKQVKARVESFRVALLEELFAERGGRESLDLVSRISIENYALACSQQKIIEMHIDQVGVLTAAGRRRAAFDMSIGLSAAIDRLRQQLPPVKTKTQTSKYGGIDAMPTSALQLANDLLTRSVKGVVLTERERGMLDVLQGAIDGQIVLPHADIMPDLVPETPLRKDDDDDYFIVPENDDDDDTARPTPPPAPAPRPMCAYGCSSSAQCVELKTTRLDVWRTLHARDPAEVARRNDEATAVMMYQIGKPPRW